MHDETAEMTAWLASLPLVPAKPARSYAVRHTITRYARFNRVAQDGRHDFTEEYRALVGCTPSLAAWLNECQAISAQEYRD